MPDAYYQDRLYPFQDEILKAIKEANVDFYLTGGTALSRCYLNHRYSDDLDFFVNNHPLFKEQGNKVVSLLRRQKWDCNISTTTETFVRLFLESDGISIKIDFVNDIPTRFGDIQKTDIFQRVDHWRNILSNKLCALSRMEAKDLADILFISKKFSFSWEEMIRESREKDIWVDPIEICKIINSYDSALFETIKWIDAVDLDELTAALQILHNDIFYGNNNSLVGKK